MEELIPIQTPQGITYVSPNEYLRTLGCASNLGAVDPAQAAVVAAGAASASIAAGGTTAAALTAIGVSSQAIPVVGQILGGLALIGGLILNARAKAKAAKAQSADVDVATASLQIQNAELDSMMANAQRTIANIKSEINRLGLNGTALDGFGDWLKKTFTPGRYQEGILQDKTAYYNQLVSEVENKIGVLEQAETELKRLYDQLTGGKNFQKILLIGGGVAVGLGVLYFLNEKFKWIKI